MADIVTVMDGDCSAVLGSLTVNKSEIIITSEQCHVSWYTHVDIVTTDDKLTFGKEIHILPLTVDKQLSSIIRNKKRKCIYDSGDDDFYNNKEQLSSTNKVFYHTYDDSPHPDEISNYTIWACDYEDNNGDYGFYLLVVGSCGYTCSGPCHFQYWNCNVYVCDILTPLIEYAMTESQRNKCAGDVWVDISLSF